MEQGNLFASILPIVVIFAIMYFLIIRPQQKQAKDHKAMVDALAKGDKIVTSGGIKCSVVKTNEDFITVKLNDEVMVELDKQFVARKLDD
ncbi:preprotein translocase subunit YajC [uncultured Campylobacter sp.]|uniref:preprotein translocase subunit YajC n=1 Tax=uncultured Campylobacter sp. TaxID=218934 RepID=UPI00262B4F78|nr:preprotein translocase subunit YajC [uncultured Campylobacter sp.]